MPPNLTLVGRGVPVKERLTIRIPLLPTPTVCDHEIELQLGQPGGLGVLAASKTIDVPGIGVLALTGWSGTSTNSVKLITSKGSRSVPPLAACKTPTHQPRPGLDYGFI
jgi:hypothetical protein